MKLTKIMFTVCLLFHASVLFSQESVVVTGKVYDDMGPLLMANVLEIDINDRIVSQAVTDINGEFSLSVKNKNNRIKISYVGCKTLISEIGEQKVFSLKMESDNKLSEVVITAKKMHTSGGLTIPEREVSSAVQTIEAKEFEGLAISSIDEALQGRIAGLDIVYNSGDLGAGTSMRLRGVSSISSSSEPLIVVDGEVWNSKEDYDVSNATSEQFADLLAINPEDIESITVLKDAASTAIWGSQGANGVIMIKTSEEKEARKNCRIPTE
jgi:TonB-dependent SusC/RagA subfamily outer membrane receptor